MPLHTNQSNQSTDSNKQVNRFEPNKPVSRFKPIKTIQPAKPAKPVKSVLLTHLRVKGVRPSLNPKRTKHTNSVVNDSELIFFLPRIEVL